MGRVLLIALFSMTISIQANAHEGCAGGTLAGRIACKLGISLAVVSVVWNAGEIVNHGLGFWGIGEQHSHEECTHHHHDHEHSSDNVAVQWWHGFEIGMHLTNLVGAGAILAGVAPAAPLLIAGALANMAGAYAQSKTAYNRGLSWVGIAMLPFSSIDLIAHLVAVGTCMMSPWTRPVDGHAHSH